MTDISVSMTSEQADKMLPLLKKVRAGAKGEERKTIDRLLRDIEKTIDQRNALNALQKEQDKCADEVNFLAKLVLDTIPYIKRRGLTAEVVTYINSVDKIFRQGEKDIEGAKSAYQATLPRAQRDQSEIPSDVFIKTLAPTRRKLGRAIDTFKASSVTPLEASENYELAPKRLTLAKKCLGTALNQGVGAGEWNEIDMVAMCFGDMNTHLQLGVAILSGNVSRIENASNMDTACRDGIDNNVWQFVISAGDDGIDRVTRAKPKR